MSVVRLWGVGLGSGESARLPPPRLRCGSRTWRHMWIEFVAGSRPCPESFFSGSNGFPLYTKKTHSKTQLDLETVEKGHLAKVPLFSLLLWLWYSSNHYTHLSHGSNMLWFCSKQFFTFLGSQIYWSKLWSQNPSPFFPWILIRISIIVFYNRNKEHLPPKCKLEHAQIMVERELWQESQGHLTSRAGKCKWPSR